MQQALPSRRWPTECWATRTWCRWAILLQVSTNSQWPTDEARHSIPSCTCKLHPEF